jgi:hypothetical protein
MMDNLQIVRTDRGTVDVFLAINGDFNEDPKEPYLGMIDYRLGGEGTEPFSTDEDVDSRIWISFDPDRAVTDADYEAANRALYGDDLYDRLLGACGEFTGTAEVPADHATQMDIFHALMRQPALIRPVTSRK